MKERSMKTPCKISVRRPAKLHKYPKENMVYWLYLVGSNCTQGFNGFHLDRRIIATDI